MSNDNGNKLAHPCTPEGYEPEFGLTKREYFAVMAMQAYITKDTELDYEDAKLAQWSVEAADALLAALEAGDE